MWARIKKIFGGGIMAKAKKVSASADVGGEGYIAVLDTETKVLRKATDEDVTSGSGIGEELLYVTPVTPEKVEEIRKDNKKKELMAKQAALRQEMIDAGIEPPPIAVVQAPPPPRTPTQAVEGGVIKLDRGQPQLPQEEQIITREETENGEVIKLPGGTVTVAPVAAPVLPKNPQTGRPYSPMEFDMIYTMFKEKAESHESVVCVDRGPGYFIIRTSENIPNIGKVFKGVPLVQQGLRIR
jgi:hypothetical protein